MNDKTYYVMLIAVLMMSSIICNLILTSYNPNPIDFFFFLIYFMVICYLALRGVEHLAIKKFMRDVKERALFQIQNMREENWRN
jgi:hypothetical protein